MKYDFETILDRRGKDALAIDGLGKNPGFTPEPPRDGFDSIPMWVADMNFQTAPSIVEAIIKRASHPIFGYFDLSDDYFRAIIDWQKIRNGTENLAAENISYENGVLGGVVNILNVLCSRGDNILIHSPTYVGFSVVAENNGYHLIHSPLVLDGDNIWRMDFDDMERKIVENKIHVAIMCSPHNPCGRVWTRAELETAMEIFSRHEVFIISDEIWSDIIFSGSQHIPTQQISDYAKTHTAAFYSPSKTFNLAGIVGAYRIIFNRQLRDRADKESSLTHYNSPNVFSMHALIGAYSETGREWTDELNAVLEKNLRYAYSHVKENYRGVKVGVPQGTYMMFLDCEDWCAENNLSHEKLLQAGWDCGVTWHDGRLFNCPHGLRMSLASPFALIREAFARLDRYVFK